MYQHFFLFLFVYFWWWSRGRGNKLQEMLTCRRAQSRMQHRKAGTFQWGSSLPLDPSHPQAPSLTAHWSWVSFGKQSHRPLPLLPAASLLVSKSDFEFCGLCHHRGPWALEECLQDGVRVHFHRRVGWDGRIHPTLSLWTGTGHLSAQAFPGHPGLPAGAADREANLPRSIRPLREGTSTCWLDEKALRDPNMRWIPTTRGLPWDALRCSPRFCFRFRFRAL